MYTSDFWVQYEVLDNRISDLVRKWHNVHRMTRRATFAADYSIDWTAAVINARMSRKMARSANRIAAKLVQKKAALADLSYANVYLVCESDQFGRIHDRSQADYYMQRTSERITQADIVRLYGTKLGTRSTWVTYYSWRYGQL